MLIFSTIPCSLPASRFSLLTRCPPASPRGAAPRLQRADGGRDATRYPLLASRFCPTWGPRKQGRRSRSGGFPRRRPAGIGPFLAPGRARRQDSGIRWRAGPIVAPRLEGRGSRSGRSRPTEPGFRDRASWGTPGRAPSAKLSRTSRLPAGSDRPRAQQAPLLADEQTCYG